MPPKDEPQLNADQIALIRDWIGQGAKGELKASRLMDLSHVPKLASDPQASQRTSSAAAVGDGLIAVGRFRAVELLRANGDQVWRTAELAGKVNQLRVSPMARA